MSNTPNFDRFNPGMVDHVLDTHLRTEDPVLQQIRTASRLADLPEIEVSAQQGKFLELLVRTSGAESALEIGTLGGYSTVCIARGLHGGRVTTLEYDSHHFTVACNNFKYSGYYNHIVPLLGDALELLEKLRGNAFDFVFIDADKERNADYFAWAVDWCSPGATIVVDNVIRDGRVLDPSRPEKLEFIDTVRSYISDGRVEASVVQTVGTKGWDGFVLARKL